jgi:hypothetical protein
MKIVLSKQTCEVQKSHDFVTALLQNTQVCKKKDIYRELLLDSI